jgi:hypothetical protein
MTVDLPEFGPAGTGIVAELHRRSTGARIDPSFREPQARAGVRAGNADSWDDEKEQSLIAALKDAVETRHRPSRGPTIVLLEVVEPRDIDIVLDPRTPSERKL